MGLGRSACTCSLLLLHQSLGQPAWSRWAAPTRYALSVLRGHAALCSDHTPHLPWRRKPLNRRFIVVEGIYANTGELAPLEGLKALKEVGALLFLLRMVIVGGPACLSVEGPAAAG